MRPRDTSSRQGSLNSQRAHEGYESSETPLNVIRSGREITIRGEEFICNILAKTGLSCGSVGSASRGPVLTKDYQAADKELSFAFHIRPKMK